MIKQKLIIFIMSIYLLLIAGTTNIYPLFLNTLKIRFQFTIKQINFFTAAITIGTWSGFPISYIYDKNGPKYSSLIGVFIISFCYLIIHLFLTVDAFLGCSIYPFIIIAFLMGQGHSLLLVTGISVNLKNLKFGQNAIMIGILLSNLGISPILFTSYKEYFNYLGTEDNFYLYFALFIFVIGAMCSYIIEDVKFPYEDDKLLRKFQKYKEKNILLIFLIFNLLLIVFTFIGALINYSKGRYFIPLVAIYPILLLLTFILIYFENSGFFDEIFYPRFKRKTDSIIRSQFEMGDISQQGNNKARELKKEDSSSSLFQYNAKFIEAITSYKFILLFIGLFFGVGSVFANISNLNYIYKTIPNNIYFTGMNRGIISVYKVTELYYHVILFNGFSSIIKVSCGIFLGLLVKAKKKYLFFIIFSIFGLISQIIGIFGNKLGLSFSMIFGGMAEGGILLYAPVLIQREFGNKHIGKIFGLSLFSIALSSLIIGECVFSTKIDEHGIAEECIGNKCYRFSYITTSVFYGINMLIGNCEMDSLGTAMATYAGQNYGAGKYDRITQGAKKAIIAGCAYAVLALGMMYAFGMQIERLFITDSETAAEVLMLARRQTIIN
ncbi:MAG: hypothetical protein MJ252_01115, partial [archaeon]|nr:hypothetical protein [archaeon]